MTNISEEVTTEPSPEITNEILSKSQEKQVCISDFLLQGL